MAKKITLVAVVAVAGLLFGCNGEKTVEQTKGSVSDTETSNQVLNSQPVAADSDTGLNAYFGDVHVHTKYSFDAYIFGTRADPDDAYRFAKGETLIHPAGIEMRLKAPLDFLAVADHATYLGMLIEMDNPSSAVSKHPLSVNMRKAVTPEERDAVFREILPRERGHDLMAKDDLLDLGIVRSAWQEIIAAAERHNDPGKFTTFIGYEFTAGGERGENLHRNVIFKGSKVPPSPYSRLDAHNNPEKLWDWMDKIRAQGIEALAIPHNSNGSDGWMFELTDKAGNKIDKAYAEQRMRNEPLVEITQVKGTSDAHPLLSPNDEWADFEIMSSTIGSNLPSKPQGSYVREAFLNGLKMEQDEAINPYKFGLIGSSDTHNAAGSFREDEYWSKTGLLDATPQLRGSVPQDESGGFTDSKRQYWGASGLAGVWAESNTRDAIFRAMQRKETFATTGPRMRVRFVAGFDFSKDIVNDEAALSKAFTEGTNMGGDLMAIGDGPQPQFIVWATQDPTTAPLERLQVIKGWVEAGQTKEAVFDVACPAGAKVDSITHRCPEAGASVDLKTCEYSRDKGASELKALWKDPGFDSKQHAFYYVRVLQNPTCRWSTWDALRAGTTPNPKHSATIQERAWSSPIWYTP